MSYTKNTLRIENPTPKLLDLMQKLRKRKQIQVQKLHGMKPEEFGMHVSL